MNEEVMWLLVIWKSMWKAIWNICLKADVV